MKIKLLCSNARIPTRATEGAAGYDLYAALDSPITIKEGETKLIPTGIAMEIPEGYFGAIFPRSGFAVKRGLRLANCVAVIDSDYRGPVQVPIYRDAKYDSLSIGSLFGCVQDPETIHDGDRIAQLVILPYGIVDFEVADELDNTDRGDGGFGSTGA